MGVVSYLAKSVNLLNIGLFATTGAVVLVAVAPVFHAKVRYVPPVAKPKAVLQEEAPDENGHIPSPAEYMIMVENNLFHPERRLPPEKKDAKPLPKPELVLFGTVISDSMSIAYIEDKKSPKTSEGRGKRQSVVRKGDIVSGFVVRDIQTDRIVLVRGEESIAVPLSEAGKQRGGDKASAGAASVQVAAKSDPLSAPQSLSASHTKGSGGSFQRNPVPVTSMTPGTARAPDPQNVLVPSLSTRSVGRYQKMQGLR